MENASKALLIAGALLIAILLITIGIAIYNSAGGILNQGKTALSAQEVTMFNQKFEAYEGQISGSSLKSLINIVNVNNKDDNNPKIEMTGVEGNQDDGYSVDEDWNALTRYNVDMNDKDEKSGLIKKINVS